MFSDAQVFCANGHFVDRELPQNLIATGNSFDQVGHVVAERRDAFRGQN
jgi:hypothetical protein